MPPPAHGFSIASVGLQPHSRGSVSLRSADPREAPEISPGYLEDPEDVRVLVEGTKLARRIADTGKLGRWLSGERAPGDGVAERRGDRVLGAQRGPDDLPPGRHLRARQRGGLRARVNGLESLRVVDASVMPNVNRGHTHAPTTMIAERAAELIRASATG